MNKGDIYFSTELGTYLKNIHLQMVTSIFGDIKYRNDLKSYILMILVTLVNNQVSIFLSF